MKAVVFHSLGNVSVDDVPNPLKLEDSIIVRVKAAAICATDLRIFRGERSAKENVILGHEFSGEVVDTGSNVKDFNIGDRVAVYPILADGKCEYCLKGFRNRCVSRKTLGIDLNGGFSEFFQPPPEMVKLGHIIKLPQNVSFEEAALLEPISTVINSLEKLQAGFGDNILIVGAGPMGLIHVMLSKLKGVSNILVSDYVEDRLNVAKELGANYTINPGKEDFGEKVKEFSKNFGGINKAILTVGVAGVVEQLLDIIQPQGMISLFAGGGKTFMSNLDLNKIHYKEIILTATQNATPEQFRKAIGLLSSGSLDAKRLITHKFPLENAIDALNIRSELKALKVLLIP